MLTQFIHLILLCYGATDGAGSLYGYPITGCIVWLLLSVLIVARLLPAYTNTRLAKKVVPPFFKTYNIFCFIIVTWIFLFFAVVNPVSYLPDFFSKTFPETTALLLAASLYMIFLKFFMASLYELLKPVLDERQEESDFLRARQTVAIIFFPPVICWTVFEDMGISQGMELISEIKTMAIAPIFLWMLYMLSPRLFNWAWKAEKPKSAELTERLMELAKKSETPMAGVKIWNTFREPIPNAAVAGLLSRFRYIYVTDYLLEEFSSSEAEAVIGHELGHLRLGHVATYLIYSIAMIILAIIAKSCLVIYFPFFYVHSELAYILEFIVFLPVFGITFTAMTRYSEKQADAFSCAITSNDDFISAMARLNSLVMKPPKWLPKWLMTHPEITERIKNAKNNEDFKISSLIMRAKVLRYSLLVVAVVLILVATTPAGIVMQWSNLYKAAQAGNCGLVMNLYNSLPEWLKDHPFVIEQMGKVTSDSSI